MQTILDRALRVNTMKFLIFITSIFILITVPAQSASSCEPDSCDSNNGPRVRFPFRLENRQPARCGYPGFDLYCNSKNQTIVNLPMSGKFIVDYIDYKNQRLLIDDPGSCLTNRALNFSLSGSPFQVSYSTKFTYLNCSGDRTNDGWSDDYILLFCLSDGNNTVLASSPAAPLPPRCRRVANVSVPPVWAFARRGSWSMELKQDFVLDWIRPDCGNCENRGGICRYKGDSGFEIGCSKPSGLSRTAKYALTIGVGIPGLLGLIGFAYYTWGKLKSTRHQHGQNSDIPITTIFNQRPSIRASGLDLPTIESYPKTVLGQSCRLPKPSDNTCLICLCEYQPKESLRSIPNCNHYFHVDCIDEWLKLNGTCPICRDSSARSSISTSFWTSLSLSSPSSSLSVTMNHQLSPTH